MRINLPKKSKQIWPIRGRYARSNWRIIPDGNQNVADGQSTSPPTATPQMDDTLWIDQLDGSYWRVNFGIIPASATDGQTPSALAVNGWNFNGGQIFLYGGRLSVRIAPPFLNNLSTIPSLYEQKVLDFVADL